MNASKIIIYITILTCVLMISIPTLYKVINENYRKLYIVSEKEIVEAAEKCYYADDCENATITLKELYEHKYLEKGIIDPVTKEIYNDNSYVVLTKKDSSFYPA